MTPLDLYRACEVSACRLETLQVYAGDDEGRQRALLRGDPLPPPNAGRTADLELIASLRQAGRLIQRVHLVALPLSPYMRWELAVYRENVEAGEDVRIADLSVHPGLAGGSDFAVFDAGTPAASAILFGYDATGQLRGYEHVTGRPAVANCAQRYAAALACSVSLDEFMAAVG